MAHQSKKHLCDNRGIERLLESKLIEADKNIMFALAFENSFFSISDMCNMIAEDNIEDVKSIGRVLLENAYNPKLRINSDISSIDLKSDFPCKGPYSAVGVINYNFDKINRISQYTKNLMLGEELINAKGLMEALNTVFLRDLEKLEILRKMLEA